MHYHRSYYILVRAKNRISNPIKWTKNTLARNEKGEPVSPVDSKAVCWCAKGAVCVESEGLIQQLEVDDKLNDASVQLCGCTDYTRLNDALEHCDVMLMFDKAIAFAKSL